MQVLHQVKTAQRTGQYKHNRADEAAAYNCANQLVTTASLSVFPRSTLLSALGLPVADATQFEEEPEHWIQFEIPAQLDKLLFANFGKVTVGSASSLS